MRPSNKTLLILLVIGNILCIAALFVLKSKVFFNGDTGAATTKFIQVDTGNVVAIEIACTKSGSVVNLCNSSGKWMCNFADLETLANRHAVTELMAAIRPLKFTQCENGKFDCKNCDWSVNLTNDLGEVAKLKISRTPVHLLLGGICYLSDGQKIAECLAKIFPELCDKSLCNGICDVSRMRFKVDGHTISFARSNGCFKMDLPFNRSMKNEFVENVLGEILSLQCNNVSKADGKRPAEQPLFTLDLEHDRVLERIEFFGKYPNFYTIKAGLICQFSGKAADAIRNLHYKLANFRPFAAVKNDSISISDLLEGRQIFLQKLENNGGWQRSHNSGTELTFTDIDGEKIQQIEGRISELSNPIGFRPNSHKCIAKLNFKTDIGNLNFDIFKNSDCYVILNSESSLTFSIDEEFATAVFSLF
jgi:hypothetical protein